MPDPKNAKHLYWIGVLVLALGAVVWWYSTAHDAVPGIPAERYDDVVSETASEPDSAEACSEAGGSWNECASACPDAGPDEVCIEVCVERCEGLGLTLDRQVYFTNWTVSSREVPGCEEVAPARRALTRSSTDVSWPTVAVRSLLEGTTETEEEAGFASNIPDGVSLLTLRIEDRVARADFSSELNAVAGSCRVTAIRSQIERTLTQFPEIDEVVISVEGNVEEALQP